MEVYVVCQAYGSSVLGVFKSRESAYAAIDAEYYPNEWKIEAFTVQPWATSNEWLGTSQFGAVSLGSIPNIALTLNQ